MKRALVIVACAVCVEWTRLSGTVKGIDLQHSTVTIQDRDGYLLTVPVDYQVKIMEKHDEMRDLKHLVLDEKIMLTRMLMEKPVEDTTGMAQPERQLPEKDQR
jgi:hypothetical protein